jgi:hypothetical protein
VTATQKRKKIYISARLRLDTNMLSSITPFVLEAEMLSSVRIDNSDAALHLSAILTLF